MKKLLASLALLLTVTAHAREIKIADFSQYQLWGSASVSQEFAFNAELGRAWVEVRLTDSDPESTGVDITKVKVAGMSYDKATGNINIDSEGRITTCAVVSTRGRSVFRYQEIKHTNCKFQGRWRKVSYDDGFEIKHTQKYGVFLIIKE